MDYSVQPSNRGDGINMEAVLSLGNNFYCCHPLSHKINCCGILTRRLPKLGVLKAINTRSKSKIWKFGENLKNLEKIPENYMALIYYSLGYIIHHLLKNIFLKIPWGVVSVLKFTMET